MRETSLARMKVEKVGVKLERKDINNQDFARHPVKGLYLREKLEKQKISDKSRNFETYAMKLIGETQRNRKHTSYFRFSFISRFSFPRMFLSLALMERR